MGLDGFTVQGFRADLCYSLTLHRALLVHLALGQCIYTGLTLAQCHPTGPCSCVIYCDAVQLPRAVIKSSITSSEGAGLGSSALHFNLIGWEINFLTADQTEGLNLVIKAYFLGELLHSLIKLWCDQRGKMKEFPLCSSNNMSLTAWKLCKLLCSA